MSTSQDPLNLNPDAGAPQDGESPQDQDAASQAEGQADPAALVTAKSSAGSGTIKVTG